MSSRRPARTPSLVSAGGDLVITCDLDLFGQHLSLFTTLTTFGSPVDVTLDELLIELFFPADPATQDALQLMHT